jgi:signal transduction histidine kinase
MATVRAGYRSLASVAALGGGLAVILTVLLVRTLKKLRRSQSDLSSALENLEVRNRDLDAFAGRVAHDVRNVLAPLRMAVEQLGRKAASEGVRRSADRIVQITERADRLIDALLAFARAGHSPDPVVSADLNAAAQEASDALEVERARVDAVVEVHGADHIAVRCAPDLLHVVFVNLLGNALKFLGGHDTRRVDVSIRRVGVDAEVTVSDTGPGVPEAARERVFDPFFRVQGTAVAGTGIGLATVRRVIEAHGGHISVTAAPQGGARFVFSLPLARTGHDSALAIDSLVVAGPRSAAVGPVSFVHDPEGGTHR